MSVHETLDGLSIHYERTRDPGWTLDGPWMDPGWTLDGLSIHCEGFRDPGWTLDGPWMF